MNTGRKIFVVLVVIVLLPALFYSAYQISTLNETEELMQQVSTRQLDAILFSVNQYVLDVASSWANQVENGLASGENAPLTRISGAIESVTVADTALMHARVVPPSAAGSEPFLRRQREEIGRLLRYRSVNYRKLEPVVITDSTFMMMFVTTQAPPRVIGILISNERFIDEVIAKKLDELAQNEFLFAVFKGPAREIAYATAPFPPSSVAAAKQLWIFPTYSLGIRVRGETLTEVMHDRYVRNLILILVSDLVLVAGLLFVYRTIRKEMELVSLKTDFVSNVSHELRTPLSLIRMFAETLSLKRVPTEKKKQEYYGIILHETERLTRLINNILNFSRMESNTRKYVFRPTDLNEVVASVLSIYAYQLESLGFTVRTTLDPSLPRLAADDEAIAEAMHNLIDNAMKYSADDRFLGVSTAQEAGRVCIRVEDHGIGIPAEHRTKIFEKFYRVSHGLVHTAKGSGLGLAIVNHIVQAHGGVVTSANGAMKGTVFTIDLPLVR